MADNALTKLTLGGQLLVSVVLGAVIFGGFYFFWLSDAWKEEATKKAKREALQKEIRALEVTANKLQEFQREVQLLEAKLDTLKRILPPEKETPDLMRRVQALAAQSFLNVKTFTPTAVVQKEFYQEVPIKMELTGSYHNLGLFFDRVSRLVAARQRQEPQGEDLEEAEPEQHHRRRLRGHDLRLPGRAPAPRQGRAAGEEIGATA